MSAQDSFGEVPDRGEGLAVGEQVVALFAAEAGQASSTSCATPASHSSSSTQHPGYCCARRARTAAMHNAAGTVASQIVF
ncbi:hypothetical protein ACFV84_13855 [Kitasatospora sp. NPDC059811]|uniref:hypothetical protein n=1 Tax=Streptomycetaceae TaxID=2062 RepID=UPI0007AF3804|nr:hypothetical protein [Streptomyces sp. MJM8645]